MDEMLFMVAVMEGGLTLGDISQLSFGDHNYILTEIKRLNDKRKKQAEEQ